MTHKAPQHFCCGALWFEKEKEKRKRKTGFPES
jgi:hypothetical protein